MRQVLFTTSWDDGHPLDLRIGELLGRHGCPGTFYVPCRNEQGRPVLSGSELRDLMARHEIGGHTLDHAYLDRVGSEEARRQIVEGKATLEDRIGSRVHGFAYPGGRHNRALRSMVRQAGFSYGRTVECFRLGLHADPYIMPTTAQIYPHSAASLLRNFLKRGHLVSRTPALLTTMHGGDVLSQLRRLLALARRRGGVLHLWGHSWEVQALDLWATLERFLAEVAEQVPPGDRVTNRGVLVRLEGLAPAE